MTELTSFGSQSSRLKMLHFLQVQLFLLEEAAELAPEEPPMPPPPAPPPGGVGDSDGQPLPQPPPPPPSSRFRAELALRRRAAEGSRAWSGDRSRRARMEVRDCMPRVVVVVFVENERDLLPLSR